MHIVARGVPLVLEHYQIFLDQSQIGQAVFMREGLYYAIKCFCKLPDSRIYGIVAICTDGNIFLGTCCPNGSDCQLQTRKPFKHFPGKVVRLDVVLKATGLSSQVTVTDESAPIPFLGMIENATISIHEGSPVLQIQKNLID